MILEDYFATYAYSRTWKDSLLQVNLYDTISRNKLINNQFSYKLLQPQTIIKNEYTTNYSRYLSYGLYLPFPDNKLFTVDITYTYPKGYFGISYMPEKKALGCKVGMTIMKFKSKK
jgi:hypothetical protein